MYRTCRTADCSSLQSLNWFQRMHCDSCAALYKHSIYVHPCMCVIPLAPSDSPTLISSLLRLSAHHLALAALASQPLKPGTLSLHLSVSVLIPFVVTPRPTTASRPSTPLNPSPLAPQIRLCWPLCAFINYIYLLTYLLLPDANAPVAVCKVISAVQFHFNEILQFLTGVCQVVLYDGRQMQ